MQLRHWKATHHNEDFGDASGRRFENELFSSCRFTRITGARFINCDMRESEIAVDDIRDLLGCAATLDCFTFSSLKLSDVALDALLFLISSADIPRERKDAIRALLPASRLELFDGLFERLEQ